jgi:metallophosphoesterase (TIGR03767 family)
VPNHQANSLGDVASRLSRLASTRRAQRGGRAPQRESGLSSAPEVAGEGVASTVEATIRPVRSGRFRLLGWAPGEPHLVHPAGGASPDPTRFERRRSLLYFAQHTDTHLCDSQSPARMEGGDTFGWINPGTDGGYRPQESLTTHVFDRMVAATNAVVESPDSGAVMAWCVQTGDNTDNRTVAEMAWWLSVLEGRPMAPDTGAAGRYEGVQRSGWRGSWHPDDPRCRDIYGRAGFPHLPGLLDAAVAEFEPVGLDVPWLAVFGNHDSLFTGTFGPIRGLRIDQLQPMLEGTSAKPTGTVGLVRAIVHATVLGADVSRWERWAERVPVGVRQVTPDRSSRSALSRVDYVKALLEDAPRHGPLGHGFTAANLAESTSWWSRSEGDHVQVIGLDTCNHTNGDGGGLGPRQFEWLESELMTHNRRFRDRTGEWVDGDGPDRLVILVSHHNSWTMDNTNSDDADPGRRVGGAELVRFLHRFPNVVLWVNGHSHEHRVIHHRRPDSTGGSAGPNTARRMEAAGSMRVSDEAAAVVEGFWEVDTASLIDFSQQGRTFELFDNGDGTVSILTTVIDHASPPRAPRHRHGRWTVGEMASLSRELAVNDARWIDPVGLLGSIYDRNVELLLPTPFRLR